MNRVRNAAATKASVRAERASRKSAASQKKKGRPATALSQLASFGIDEVCKLIVDGVILTDIAAEAGVSIGTLITWLDGDTERSARAREARAQSARTWDDKAARGIELAGNAFELARAREMAHHYRWRASKIAPREYGDRQIVAGDPDAPQQHTIMVVADTDLEI